jgi:hypothetical protein
MLCILAFIIFLILFPILGFFPEYRRLFRRSWACVFKKVTLQPCDINLGEELKNKLLGKLFFKYPKVAKFLDKTLAFWAILFVIINIWSLWTVINSGLNLYVYDTCDPQTGESCSLSGEACGVASNSLTLGQAFNQGQLGQWAVQPFTNLGKTINKIPDRIKNWRAEDYFGPSQTFYKPKDDSKPTALEIIDPGCQYCRKLFRNIKESGFHHKYNLTYLVYPIPDNSNRGHDGYKFQASKQIATYLEAMKQIPLTTPTDKETQSPADWQFLEIIFTKTSNGVPWQDKFNSVLGRNEIEPTIQKILKDMGYSDPEVQKIADLAKSEQVKEKLQIQRDIVENRVKTIRIPTIMFAGKRYDRVLDVDTLKKA